MAVITTALAAIEAIEEEGTPEEQLQAWSYLIKDGLVWQLQGFYGRTAKQLIDNNIIDKNGKILIPEV